MATVFLVLVVVMVVAALVFGVVSLLSQDDPGLSSVEADGRARPLPNNRSLSETDLKEVRFDVSLRGYRMTQVDKVLRRTSYDLGYKDEMIAVLEAEVIALREGRLEDADLLRKARESAANPNPPAELVNGDSPTLDGGPEVVLTEDIRAEDLAAAGSVIDTDTDTDIDAGSDPAPGGPAAGGSAPDPTSDHAAPDLGATGPVGSDGVTDEDGPAESASTNGKAGSAHRSAHA